MSSQLADKIRDPEQWFLQFEALDDLRRVNKFYPELLFRFMGQYEPFIKESVDNLRSGISKNSLMFVHEFFKGQHHASSPEHLSISVAFVKSALPNILHKTVYDKVFISNEANHAVLNCLKTCLYKETLQVLINDGCDNKLNNIKLKEKSYGYLSNFVENSDASFFLWA